MGMNFPSSPTEGATYASPIGVVYSYTNGAWTSKPSQPIADAPSDGQFYARQTNGWAPLPIVQTALPRNRIVNGLMRVSQEYAPDTNYTVAAYSQAYVADQWMVQNIGPTNPITAKLRSDDPQRGFIWRLDIRSATVQSTLPSDSYVGITQPVEMSRILCTQYVYATNPMGVPLVLRFNARAEFMNAFTFCVSIRSLSGVRCIVKKFTTGSADTDFVWAIPPDLVGDAAAWNAGFVITFCLAANSAGQVAPGGTENQWQNGDYISLPGQQNLIALSNNPFSLSKVGLYVDPLATGVPPSWEDEHIQTDLWDCYRYYIKQVALPMRAITWSTTQVRATHRLPVRMRQVPAVSFFSELRFYCWVSNNIVASIASSSNTNFALDVIFNVTVAFTAGWYSWVSYQGITGGVILNARM